ncbi:MAG: DUF5777 family beta-barrel protein [Balneolaceae bacterium]
MKFIPLFLIITFLFTPFELYAQLERKRAMPEGPVELTFMAPRNINLYTVESLSKGELHYSIMHTFGEVKSGVKNLWGIDQGANVRFSFEYGFSDRFSLGFGRSSLDKIYDFTARLALVKQAKTGGLPISASLIPTLGINTSDFSFLNQDYIFTDRLNFGLSIPVARKFNEKLSIQASPMLIHFNRVGPELNVADPVTNTYYSLGIAARYKIKPRTALSFQYLPSLSNFKKIDPNLAIGIDIETGGHVFQMFFTTSDALNDQYLVAGNNGNFFAREFRFGFNVNRLFNLR